MSLQKLLLVILAGLLSMSAALAQNTDFLHEGPILIRNVTVIDGLGHLPSPMRDVLIDDGRIAKTSVTGLIGDLPKDTYVIDAGGMTAMPGLIDLHVHLGNISFPPDDTGNRAPAGVQKTLNAHLYAGVTTVQDLGNDHDYIIGIRDAIRNDKRIGPTVFASGETIQRLQTPKNVGDMTSPETQAEIKALLDAREVAGIETIKLYAGMSNWGARHVMTAAKKRGMQGIADFWCTNLSRTTFEVTLIDGYGHGGCREITAEEAVWMRDNGKFAILTLMAFDTMGGHRAFVDYRTKGALNDPLIVDPLGKDTINEFYSAFPMLREILEDGEASLYAAQLFGDLKHLLPDNQKNAVTLYKAGVLIGLGTDSAFPPGTWPGEAMHHEMELHVQAGIPPIEVIKMATHNGAKILRREHEFGSIESGKIANILIVRGDPSINIRNTRNVEFVIKEGRLVDRKALRAQ